MPERLDRPPPELDAIRTLPVRVVAYATLPAGAFAVLVGAATGTDLRAWAVSTSVVFLAAVAQLWLRKPHPPILMVVAATVLMVAARFFEHDAIPPIAAGVLTVGLAVTVVFAPTLRSLPYVVWITVMTCITLWWEHRSWPYVVGLVALCISVTIGWVVLRTASRQLWQAERRYRGLFESAGDGLIAVDADHRIVLANDRACRALGAPAEELAGKPVSDVLPGSGRLLELPPEPKPFETLGRRTDGTEFPVELTTSTLEANGESLWLASIHDISDRVRAERRARRGERVYRDLFESVPVGLYRTSPAGRILDANPALADILGFDRLEDLVGANARDLFADPEDRDDQLEKLDATQGALRSELRFRRRDGQVIWVRDRARAVRDPGGSVVLYEGAIQDITDEHRAMARLEQEIKSKTELVAAVSHELRTPLTGVLGFIDLLMQEARSDDDEQREYLQLASQQANELAFLIEDLLTSAHIEHDELVVTAASVDLWESVATAVEALGSQADVDVTSSIDPGLTVWCDPIRVRQIIRNLLANALAHGQPPIHVSGGCSVDGCVELVVADHGEGIRPGMDEQVFEAFFRGYDAKTRPGSIGLGLAVSRRLARVMGGDLHYRRRGDLTEFVIRLPATEVDGRSGKGTDSEAAVA